MRTVSRSRKKAKNSNEEVRRRIEEEIAQEMRHWDEEDKWKREEEQIGEEKKAKEIKKRDDEKRVKKEEKWESKGSNKERCTLVDKPTAEDKEEDDEA